MTYVRSYDRGLEYLEHLDGVTWVDAPKPRRWHRCWAQTRGTMAADYVERCPCGAIKFEGHWMERNARR